MKTHSFSSTVLALIAAFLTAPLIAAAPRPNVLFIAVDDWNDWVGCLGHKQAITPNLDRLAAGGMLFTNAHCAAPVCNPSRTAVMLGRLPSSTGIYNNGQWWRPAHPDTVTLPAYFRSHGYHVAGAGKLFHHTAGFNDPLAYDSYYFWNPEVAEAEGWSEAYHHPHWPGVKHKPASAVARKTKSNFDYAAIDLPEEQLPDTKVALWAADQLAHKHDKPFFLAVGMFRPHLEWYAPRKYFDMYPLSKIRLPRVKDDDLDDLPPIARKWAADRGSNHAWIRESGEWPKLVQAYLACISYSDAQVGRILDALEAGPNADNTIVVLWSDHGYHLGEKQHWHKFVLWERSTRVPLIVRAPGITRPGSRCGRPVSLVDLYPTLADLCGLPAKPGLDGRSIVPLLKDPAAKWPFPAVCVQEPGNCAVRSENWRYIRYSDGSEELYDHSSDPDEWTNLAAGAEYRAVIADHARWVPRVFAPPAPSKGAYRFDPAAFTWTNKKTGKITRGQEK